MVLVGRGRCVSIVVCMSGEGEIVFRRRVTSVLVSRCLQRTAITHPPNANRHNRALVLEKTAAQASLHKLETELATVKRYAIHAHTGCMRRRGSGERPTHGSPFCLLSFTDTHTCAASSPPRRTRSARSSTRSRAWGGRSTSSPPPAPAAARPERQRWTGCVVCA